MKRRTILPLVLAASLAAPFAPLTTTASAESSFTFYGSGYGHGIGMSQWGAYGLAKAGWLAEDIATYYYAGTEISTLGEMEPIRVGLANGRSAFSFTAQGGPVTVTVGGAEVGQIPDGSTWSVVPDGTAYDILDATGAPVAPAVGDAGTPVVIVPGDARVKVPELGRTYGRGQLEVGSHLCGSTCKLRLVAVVPLEQYLYGLAEVPNTWPAEALAAQAIVARTYAVTKATVSQHRSPCDCAVYASTVDQVYTGMDKETSAGGANWTAAVDATAGEVVTYQGATIQAFYMTSSGGYTEDNDKAWGGVAIPYLRGVCDPGDFVAANPNAAWTVTLSATDVSTKLNLNVGTVTGFSVVSRGVSGRILSVTVTGDAGSATIGGSTLQQRLGLKDDRLWIGKDLRVGGAIREKYDALGCAPGQATSPAMLVRDGYRQKFERAQLFQGPSLKAFALSGAMLDFYLSQKGPKGALGFPLSDVRTLSNGATRARFQGGTVTCKPSGTPCRIGTATA